MPTSRNSFGDIEKRFFDEPDGPTVSSLAPHEIDHFEDLDRENRFLGPAVAARRARLRLLVAGIVGIAGFVSVLVGVRLALQSKRPEPPAAILAAQTVVASVELPTDTPSPLAIARAAAPPTEQTADPVADSHGNDDRPAVTAADARQAKDRLLLAIERGHYRHAITLGQAAVDADPTDAENYLLFGTALQETGQWKRAAQVFSECARTAKHGTVGECISLTRH